jgi:hypothetical protein
MLAPGSRHVYLDALRPPSGFALDRAVGTTYSLDLETLLAVPLGFAMLDWENQKGSLAKDPVALLHALRRCADRVTIFCQAGRIASPSRHHPLFAHLEPMVVEANAPDLTASFHAKTWLLRFVNDEQRVIYRFICLSRNLTPDRSWDTILTLEGDLAERERAFSRNHPLGDFIAALAGLAQRPLAEPRREALATLADEVRRVRFDPPEPFEEIIFWPMGIGHRRFPLGGRFDRLLVVSPFLSDGFLDQVADLGADTIISRPESLEVADPAVLKKFSGIHVLDDAAVEEDADAEEGNIENASVPAEAGSARGLHAKLFIADQGWNTSVWTGSANATHAAFNRNVEFMVQLQGKKSKVGIDAFLGGSEGQGLLAFLRPFTVGDRRVPDPEVEENEKRADALRRQLAGGGLSLRVEPTGGDSFDLVLLADAALRPETGGIAARCWPAAVSTSMAHSLEPLWTVGEVRFNKVTVHALTSFIAFEVVAGGGAKSAVARFVLNLPMDGAPADRIDRVLHAVLGDRARLLRYLLFLLARDEDLSSVGAALLSCGDRGQGDEGGPGADGSSLPLFEELLRSLARAPEKLGAVARLVADLKRTAEGAALLPDGFDAMWNAIWSAREVGQRGAGA